MIAPDSRYGPEVRRRMRELPRAGAFAAATRDVCVGRAGGESQGALVELSLHVVADRVEEARFRAYGCPHLVASASWLAENLRGLTRAEVERWDWREAQVALHVPPAKFGRLLTLQDAARDAARNWPATVAV
jgi:NifU-like protein involved in Fe-S cluster formation